MEPTHRPDWMGLLSSTAPAGPRCAAATRGRTKRNLWVIAGFFGLVIASLVNSLM